MIDYAHAKSHDRLRVRRRNVAVSVLFELLWMGISVVIVGLLTGAFSSAVPMLGAMTPFMSLLILVALAMLLRGARRKQGMLAVNYLEQAVRQNLPIPPMLAAAERAESGTMRRRLGNLRRQIEGGAPVSIALAVATPGVPARALGVIAVGERIGRLPEALARVVRPAADKPEEREPVQMIYLRWYPLAMLLSLGTVATTLIIFVIPKYKDIFRDFGLPLPAITEWVLDAYVVLAAPFAVAMALVTLVFCGRMFASVIPIPGPPFSMWRWLTDRLAWVTPVWRGSARSRGLADLSYAMADAVEIGQPMDLALLECADACTNLVLHNRVIAWSQYVTLGTPIAEAARKAGLPALVPNLLRTADGPAGVRNVFLFLARYYDSRHGAAAALIQGAAVPVMVAIFGGVIACLALAMFLPLVTLMNHLPVTGRLL